jgi:hypothetical protein
MHLPLFVPRWAIHGLLLLVGCVAVWPLLGSSDSGRPTLLPQSDPWFEAPRWSPGADEYGLEPEDGRPGNPEPDEGGGLHMGVVQRDGEWRVLGGLPRSSGSDGYVAAMPIASTRAVTGTPRPVTGTPRSNGGRPAAGAVNPSSPLVIPSFFGEALFTPLAGAPSRAVAFSEWESYRTDVAGENILVTTDDSNFVRDRNGKINGNTGDTDASGLNVTDASDSVIYGTESADFPPWDPNGSADEEEPEEADESEEEGSEPDEVDDVAIDSRAVIHDVAAMLARAPVPEGAAVAAVVAPSECDPDGDDCGDDEAPPAGGSSDDFDFPYVEWVQSASRDVASSVHTDEGTTLASGADALVIGADGYDDDDNRAAGKNIIITRDDGNVVIGGTGDVNAQIGDSEQGAVIMDVERVFIQGGGAY